MMTLSPLLPVHLNITLTLASSDRVDIDLNYPAGNFLENQA